MYARRHHHSSRRHLSFLFFPTGFVYTAEEPPTYFYKFLLVVGALLLGAVLCAGGFVDAQTNDSGIFLSPLSWRGTAMTLTVNNAVEVVVCG